jgi:hypothetical protein
MSELGKNREIQDPIREKLGEKTKNNIFFQKRTAYICGKEFCGRATLTPHGQNLFS